MRSQSQLREFIRTQQVRWNVSWLTEMFDENRVNVGFEMELVATHGILPNPPKPGCPECLKLFHGLTEVAQEVLP